jgi:hypothetical protein
VSGIFILGAKGKLASFVILGGEVVRAYRLEDLFPLGRRPCFFICRAWCAIVGVVMRHPLCESSSHVPSA